MKGHRLQRMPFFLYLPLKMKKILILGGTNFIGRVFTEQLLALENYDITMFHRGTTNSRLFQNLRRILGDRYTEDILKVTKEDWDIIVDISCYFPSSLELLIPNLKGHVGRYIYISTVSVYDWQSNENQLIAEDYQKVNFNESQIRHPEKMKHYAEKKAACEAVLDQQDWLDKIILRPALVYGKYDYTDRLYYWIHRITNFQKILIPSHGSEKVNFTFVDDLAAIMREAIMIKKHQTHYNLTTHDVIPLHHLYDTIAKVSNKNPEFINLSPSLAEAHDLKPWVDIPLCTNFQGKSHALFDNQKIKSDFKTEFTPFERSILETYRYYQQLNFPKPIAGISRVLEDQLINESSLSKV